MNKFTSVYILGTKIFDKYTRAPLSADRRAWHILRVCLVVVTSSTLEW